MARTPLIHDQITQINCIYYSTAAVQRSEAWIKELNREKQKKMIRRRKETEKRRRERHRTEKVIIFFNIKSWLSNTYEQERMYYKSYI